LGAKCVLLKDDFIGTKGRGDYPKKRPGQNRGGGMGNPLVSVSLDLRKGKRGLTKRRKQASKRTYRRTGSNLSLSFQGSSSMRRREKQGQQQKRRFEAKGIHVSSKAGGTEGVGGQLHTGTEHERGKRVRGRYFKYPKSAAVKEGIQDFQGHENARNSNLALHYKTQSTGKDAGKAT